MLRIRAHDLTVLFQTPFTQTSWHNFAVVLDSDKLTIQAFYSIDSNDLTAVSGVKPNTGVASGVNGTGDYHFGMVKVRLSRYVLLSPLLLFLTHSSVAHIAGSSSH
jgi:Glycoside hydrolase 131 catalytic N-terminal domain